MSYALTAADEPIVAHEPNPDPESASRAGAVYIAGTSADGARQSFRLPLPPSLDRATVWAAARRMRRAYVATLDAMRTGQVAPHRREKLERLYRDARSDAVRDALGHYLRVLDAIERDAARRPLLPPSVRLLTPSAAVPREAFAPRSTLDERLSWTIDWLRTHGYVAAGELPVRWRVG
jgi:hypothetical protein